MLPGLENVLCIYNRLMQDAPSKVCGSIMFHAGEKKNSQTNEPYSPIFEHRYEHPTAAIASTTAGEEGYIIICHLNT